MCMELCFSRAKFCSPAYTHSVASVITAAPCSGLLVNAVSLCCPFPGHICHQAPCLLSTQQSLHQHPPLTNIPSFCCFPPKPCCDPLPVLQALCLPGDASCPISLPGEGHPAKCQHCTLLSLTQQKAKPVPAFWAVPFPSPSHMSSPLSHLVPFQGAHTFMSCEKNASL